MRISIAIDVIVDMDDQISVDRIIYRGMRLFDKHGILCFFLLLTRNISET